MNRIIFLPLAAGIAIAVFHFNCQVAADEVKVPEHSFIQEPKGIWSGDYSADSLKLMGLYDRYRFYDNSMKYDSAIEFCRAVIELGGPMMEYRFDSLLYQAYAKAYGGIGWNLMELGHYEEALAYSKFSLEKIKERFGENHIRATEICVGISSNYLRRGDYEHALEYMLKSTHIMNQIFDKNHRYFGNNYGSLGEIYMKLGETADAKKYFIKALENRIALKRTGADWTRVIKDLAECHLELGELEEAENLVERGYAYLKPTPDYHLHAFTLHFAKAQVHFAKGELDEARNAALQFLAEYVKGDQVHENIPVSGDGYFLLAEIESKAGRLENASAYYDQAVNAWDNHFGYGASLQIKALQGKAGILNQSGQFQEALGSIQAALERTIPEMPSDGLFSLPSLEQAPASEDLLAILTQKTFILQDAYKTTGDENFLFATWETADWIIAYLHASREGFHGENSKLILSRKAMPVVETALICAKELWSRTGEELYLKEAFKAIEKIKSIVLLESLHENYSKKAANISQDLWEREAALQEERALYDRLIMEERQKGSSMDSARLYYWHNKRLSVMESHDSLTSGLKERYPVYYQLKRNLPTCTVDEVQDFLSKREVLVNYFLGDSTLTVFFISSADYSVHQIPWNADEDALLNAFVSFSKRPDQEWNAQDLESWANSGERLFQLLLPAWQKYPEPASLIIIPDGKLSYLPFHLLMTGQSKGAGFRELPYLIKTCPVRYQFSSSLLLQPFRPSKKANTFYAGFAPSYQDAEFPASRSREDSLRMAELFPEIARDGLSPLLFNRSEVETAAALWGSTAFVGEQATEDKFKKTAPDARLLHLAMHALTNDQEPLFSQLIFSDGNDTAEDGKLYNYELENLELNADLTVLSACSTGAGRLRRGEGVMSVSRAFRLAGCPNIVMSLWQANDRSTGQLVSHFFKELGKGEGKSRALRTSTLVFLQTSEERYTHPFYWGNMMLIGDDEPIRNERHLWGILILSLSITAGLVLYKGVKAWRQWS